MKGEGYPGSPAVIFYIIQNQGKQGINRIVTLRYNIMFYLFLKRICDIIIGLIGLLILIPISLIVKIAYISTGDWHSIFYTQKRIGKDGKIFTLFKFRTMVWNAEEELVRLLNTDPTIKREYTKFRKLAHDPRITKIGKFLRNYSIDEFPQFINLLIGDMSLIGNRPYLLSEKPYMGKYYQEIIKTKPGITGLWQISSHNQVLFKERLRLEATYTEKFKHDFGIFLGTFKILLSGSNS